MLSPWLECRRSDDEVWEGVPPPEARRRDGLLRLSRKGWLDKNVPAAKFAGEASQVFSELEKSDLEGTKKEASKKVGKHLEELLARAENERYAGGGEVWSGKSWYDRMEAFMKPENSTVLAEQRRESEERRAAFKRAFEGCGTECSQRKRFKHGFSVEAGEDF